MYVVTIGAILEQLAQVLTISQSSWSSVTLLWDYTIISDVSSVFDIFDLSSLSEIRTTSQGQVCWWETSQPGLFPQWWWARKKNNKKLTDIYTERKSESATSDGVKKKKKEGERRVEEEEPMREWKKTRRWTDRLDEGTMESVTEMDRLHVWDNRSSWRPACQSLCQPHPLLAPLQRSASPRLTQWPFCVCLCVCSYPQSH